MNTEQINDYLRGNPLTKVDFETLDGLAQSKDPNVRAAVLLLIYQLSLQSTLHFPTFQKTLNENLHNPDLKDQHESFYRALQHVRSMLIRNGATRPNYALLTEFLRNKLSIPNKLGTEIYMSNGIYEKYPKLVELQKSIQNLQKGFGNIFVKGELDKAAAGCALIEHITPTVCGICENVAGPTKSLYADAHKGRQPNGHLLLQTLYDSKRKKKEVLQQSAAIVKPINNFLTTVKQF